MLSSLQMEDEGESSDRGSKGVTISISVNPSLSLPTRDKPVRFLCICFVVSQDEKYYLRCSYGCLLGDSVLTTCRLLVGIFCVVF